jgi:hypothetical protein
MLHYTRPERLDSDKHCSLLGPFSSYDENEVFGALRQEFNVIQLFLLSVIGLSVIGLSAIGLSALVLNVA